MGRKRQDHQKSSSSKKTSDDEKRGSNNVVGKRERGKKRGGDSSFYLDQKQFERDEAKFTRQLDFAGIKIDYADADGNCMFRSLASLLEGDAEQHMNVRLSVMDFVEKNREVFSPFMEDDEGFEDYVERMRRQGNWGGHQELYAASQLYEVDIVVHSFDLPRMEVRYGKGSRGSIQLSYHGSSHYNACRGGADSTHEENLGPALKAVGGDAEAPVTASREAAADGEPVPVPEPEPDESHVRRGAPCPCGSGLKYKKCCRKKDKRKAAAAAAGDSVADGSRDGNAAADGVANDLGVLVI